MSEPAQFKPVLSGGHLYCVVLQGVGVLQSCEEEVRGEVLDPVHPWDPPPEKPHWQELGVPGSTARASSWPGKAVPRQNTLEPGKQLSHQLGCFPCIASETQWERDTLRDTTGFL